MKNNKPDVLWIFRMPMSAFFSIEKVFGIIRPFISSFTIRDLRAKSRAVSLLQLARNCLQIRKEKADIYHITGELHYAALILPAKKTILTIHDCVFLQHPSAFRRWLLKLIWLRWPVKHARIVTTISEKSRKDIIQFSGCNAEKVVVIPNPRNPSYQYLPKTFNKAKPLILQVGIKQNKNLERVFEALSGIPCTLEIIGKLTPLHVALLEKYQIDYRNQNEVSEEALRNAYERSDLLIFASWYEGFGLPVIEAQATGRPVVTSNLEPMKTISGGAACLVDPYSVGSIREGILKVINDDQFRENLVAEGLENVKQYHPENIAKQYTDLYERVMLTSAAQTER